MTDLAPLAPTPGEAEVVALVERAREEIIARLRPYATKWRKRLQPTDLGLSWMSGGPWR